MFGKNLITSSGRSVWKCRAAAITAVGAISLGAGVGAQAAEPVMGMSPSAMKGNSSTNSMEMHQSMMKGIKGMEAMPMSGNPDRDFAMMMKAHHQAALDMAQVELKEGADPKLRGMAKNIVKSQSKEIKQFDEWLAKHPGPTAPSMMKQK